MSPAIIEGGWLLLGVAAAIAGGMMLVFSNAIMPAFGRLPGGEAIRAMQRINEDVLNPLFLGIFVGTGPAMIAWAALQGLSHGVDGLRLAGALVYVVGVVGVTMGGNVPLNRRLAGFEPEVHERWAEFARPWLRFNHLRTVAAALAAGLVLAG